MQYALYRSVLQLLASSLDVTRIPLLFLIIGLLSACQFGDPAPLPETAAVEPQITPEYVASLPPGQSRAPVNDLASQVVAAETEACNEVSEPDWGACLSTQMLLAFDRYGFLATHCRNQPGEQAVRDCVEFGRAGVDWVLALGGNPDTDFDWSKPKQAQDDALKKLNDAMTERCKGKPEEPGNSCFTSLSAKLLGLSDAVAVQCATRPELEQRGACIIDAHDAAMYQAALTALSR